MNPRRHLIVNADDFGRSPGINQGIIRCHEEGVLTSASLMVRWPAAESAAAYARAHPRLSVGLHLDLAEWRAATDGTWHPVYAIVDLRDPAAVAAEIARQLERFRSLMGCEPTHFDSHQHVHRHEPVRSLLRATADAGRRVLRNHHPEVHHEGGFYGQGQHGASRTDWISPAAFIRMLASVGPGHTEFGCHPGIGTDSGSDYCRERELECHTLCDPEVRSAVRQADIHLVSFREVFTGAGTH